MLAPRIGITAGAAVGDDLRIDLLDRRYVDVIVASGGVPLVLPVVDAELAERVLHGLDGLLLTGGIDLGPASEGTESPSADPARDAFELALVRTAVQRHVPVLGVCRGHQVLNVALGGTLASTVPTSDEIDLRSAGSHASGHRIHIASGSLLAAVVDRTDLVVEGMHDRAVRFTGAGLQVVATSADGHVAAVEGLGDVRALGVQWHPERLGDSDGQAALFAWLVREAATTPSGPVPVVGSTAPVDDAPFVVV
ncbi:MAG TPA: gamma-glutamyl-gamma-aminobutyrate hydrolase family protein [Acidimicrobiales bacterium]